MRSIFNELVNAGMLLMKRTNVSREVFMVVFTKNNIIIVQYLVTCILTASMIWLHIMNDIDIGIICNA